MKRKNLKKTYLTPSQEIELEHGSRVIHPLAPELDREVKAYYPLIDKIEYFSKGE
jgi:hypothetical protein